jgi:hypothetical protein
MGAAEQLRENRASSTLQTLDPQGRECNKLMRRWCYAGSATITAIRQKRTAHNDRSAMARQGKGCFLQ